MKKNVGSRYNFSIQPFHTKRKAHNIINALEEGWRLAVTGFHSVVQLGPMGLLVGRVPCELHITAITERKKKLRELAINMDKDNTWKHCHCHP